MVAGFVRRAGSYLGVLAVFLICVFAFVPSAWADDAIARPSTNGPLSVEGTSLIDAQGSTVQLRGVSTHGLQWFPEYVNRPLFQQVSFEWGANLVRLAFYSDSYCKASAQDASATMDTLRTGIDAAIAADMYAMVDWHILEDSDPNEHVDQALEFFGQISSEYAQSPNVIYEICNEPNGETTWTQIREYAQKVIPVIRANDPDAVIVVGTPS